MPRKSTNLGRNMQTDEVVFKEAPKKAHDGDDFDEDSDYRSKKRKHASPKKNRSPRKKARKTDKNDKYEELGEGQEIIGVVVQAPKTSQVPPGQISQNTLDFLTNLKNPACKPEWFKLNEPVYRQAEQEWKHFIEAFTEVLAEVDPKIIRLPPKDVIHPIYRDVRVSDDKTPYKKGFSATFSRRGRKGIFAAYYISVKPGNETILGAGSWCPDELATVSSKRGPQNILEMDELRVVSKGSVEDHKIIDLYKCRSFAVIHRFTDSEVLAPDFKEKVAVVARTMRPIVPCLNDLMRVAARNLETDEGVDEEMPKKKSVDLVILSQRPTKRRRKIRTIREGDDITADAIIVEPIMVETEQGPVEAFYHRHVWLNKNKLQ